MRPFVLCVLAWTLVGIIYLGQDVTRRLYLNEPRPWLEVWYWAVRVYLSAALTPLILTAGGRWPFERPVWLHRLAVHLAGSACFALVEVALETIVLAQLGLFGQTPLNGAFRRWFPFLLISGFHSGIIAYWVVLGIQSGTRFYRKFHEREQQALRLELHASELRAQLADAQLSALKAQLQPHFLFNTLNAIVVLVRQQKAEEAEEVLGRFGDLLRAVLSDMSADEVPLARELEYLRLYLSIEQLRFSDRLRVEVMADPSVLDAAVPHLGLQPLVENAIRHGIARRAAACRIDIRAVRMGDMLHITVRDDGPGPSPSRSRGGHGIGLANTRGRLLRLYGEAAALEMSAGNSGGTVVTMRLPFRVHAAASQLPQCVGVFSDADQSGQSGDSVGRRR